MSNSIDILSNFLSEGIDTEDQAKWFWQIRNEKNEVIASCEPIYDTYLKAVCGLLGGVFFASYPEVEFNKLYAEYEATLPKTSAFVEAPRPPSE